MQYKLVMPQITVRFFPYIAAMAGLLLTLFTNSLSALSPEPIPELRSTSTDGKTYATKFAISITSPNGLTQISTLLVNEAVTITGIINADPTHLNQRADIFVVMLDANTGQFYMRNLDGQFEKWNGVVKDLKPTRENVTLTLNYSTPIYTGTYANATRQQVFIGYMSKVSTALLYTPIPASFEVKTPTSTVAPLTYFSDNIENNILPRCLACHISGGLAKDSLLILDRSSSTSALNNFAAFGRVAAAKGIGYILTKATGGNAHTGGVQLGLGSTDYNNLSTFLQLQQGTTEVITVAGNLIFDGATLQTRAETLRRAAIMLAGRAPTQEEISAVSKGDESTLRTTLRNLMTGTGFHQFLIDGANDRLLVRGVQGSVIDTNFPFYPKYTTELYNLRLQASKAGKSQNEINRADDLLRNSAEDGLRRSVEELVAYIVENDKSYKGVLSANYMMMSPKVNFVMDGGAIFKDPNNPNEFQPGKINNSIMKLTPTPLVDDPILGFHYLVQPTIFRPWEHVGILNNPAFLTRYPSTATNRNRARARWTMLNFLDIDIEKSTQRPTDPAALADLNNPTLNNPACTACHERMDPVAAAYQNYSDAGFYKINYDDSLDTLYKYPANKAPTLYKKGDTWYRDMRTPGLLGQAITTATEPLGQLADLIIKDQGFASAAVKFWWPSVMNSEVLLAPAVATDSNYQAKLAAYQAQATSIEQFATIFRTHYNLKTLLVDMMMSPWFRAKATTTTSTSQRAAMAIVDAGVEKLLTPERLQRKAAILTGFNWGGNFRPSNPYTLDTNLGTGYNSYNGIYGGIDSAAVVTRARDITPLMSTVAQTFALESACPIVMKEFLLPDTLRKLFSGFTQNITPQWQGATTNEVASTAATDWKVLSLTVDLNVGNNQLQLTLDNAYCDLDASTKKCRSQRVLYLDRFEIKAPGQNSFQIQEITSAISTKFPTGCYTSNASDALTYGACAIPLDFNAQIAGIYEIRAIVAGVQASTGNIAATLTLKDVGDPLLSKSRGATLIRQKLVELHYKLHGKTYASDAPEITAVYKLLVESWQEKTRLNNPYLSNSTTTCGWTSDMNFLDGLGYSGTRFVPAKNGGDYYDRDSGVQTFLDSINSNADPTFIKQSWVVVMAYMLGHYNFLYE